MIACTLAEGPQTITRKGREAVVVVSAEEWERKTRRAGNLAEFVARSPLHGSGLNLERAEAAGRATRASSRRGSRPSPGTLAR